MREKYQFNFIKGTSRELSIPPWKQYFLKIKKGKSQFQNLSVFLDLTNTQNIASSMKLAARRQEQRWYCWCTAKSSPTEGSSVYFIADGKRKLTLKILLKSSLSTRRKWQLSSRRTMEAARGASLTRASFPKSSPSWRVQTTPCGRRSPGQTLIWTHHWRKSNTHFSIDDNVDWAL